MDMQIPGTVAQQVGVGVIAMSTIIGGSMLATLGRILITKWFGKKPDNPGNPGNPGTCSAHSSVMDKLDDYEKEFTSSADKLEDISDKVVEMDKQLGIHIGISKEQSKTMKERYESFDKKLNTLLSR